MYESLKFCPAVCLHLWLLVWDGAKECNELLSHVIYMLIICLGWNICRVGSCDLSGETDQWYFEKLINRSLIPHLLSTYVSSLPSLYIEFYIALHQYAVIKCIYEWDLDRYSAQKGKFNTVPGGVGWLEVERRSPGGVRKTWRRCLKGDFALMYWRQKKGDKLTGLGKRDGVHRTTWHRWD